MQHNVLQSLSNNQLQHHHPLQQLSSYHAQQQQQQQHMNPFQIAAMSGYNAMNHIGQVATQSMVEPYHVNVDKPVPVIKLTGANLDKHNKLYPSKSKGDKASLLKK